MNSEETSLPNEVTCILSVSGREFDPTQCAQHMGLDDVEIWHQRRAALRERADLPHAAVHIAHGPVPCESINECARIVMEKIRGSEDRIVTVAEESKLSVALTCLVRVYREQPLYVLSSDVIRKLSSIRAEFSLDVIDLRDDPADT